MYPPLNLPEIQAIQVIENPLFRRERNVDMLPPRADFLLVNNRDEIPVALRLGAVLFANNTNFGPTAPLSVIILVMVIVGSGIFQEVMRQR